MKTICLYLILALGYFYPEVTQAAEKGRTFYIDAEMGNDANSGQSPEVPWASLRKVNETTFLPGDEIFVVDNRFQVIPGMV